MRAVYIVGGAGTGKSTFTDELLSLGGVTLGPYEPVHEKRNRTALVKLRGHWMDVPGRPTGFYLGNMRPVHPGTDGLDLVCSPVATDWLRTGDLPDHLLAEGKVLATKPVLGALVENSDLLMIRLVADEETVRERFARRGTNQKDAWVRGSVTTARNRALDMEKAGARLLTIDTTDPDAWEAGLGLAADHLWAD